MTAGSSGRVAWVTGGSRGIGRAIALRLAREGIDVAISYVSQQDDAMQTVSELQKLGRRACAVPCQVGDHQQVLSAAAEVRSQLGPIDYLAHCGAISNFAEHTDLSYERWAEMINVNLTGSYSAVFAVKDEMIVRGFGRIVLVSSIAALRPRRMQIHYSSAKAGVIALTRCCAEAFAPHNIRVNCIAPGLIATDMAELMSPAQQQTVIEGTPLGRLGLPEEIANLAWFLLSEESSFTTGQTVVASGGRVMLP